MSTGGGGTGIYNLNSAGYTRNLSPNLLGGTHTLVASYNGDSSYQPSTSVTDSFTVTPAATTLSAPYSGMNPFTVGTPANIGSVMTVNLNGGVSPTGTITFYDGATPLAGTINYSPMPGTGGSPPTLRAIITTTFTTGGTHTITAQYSGDINYAAATSSALSESAVYPTNLALTLSATSIIFGQNLTATAQATTIAKNPPITGQFRFSGYPLVTYVTGTPSTDASGNQMYSATATTTLQSSDYVQAIYEGDANYAGSSAMTWVNVTTPDFSLPSTAAITVTAGLTGTTTINVTPLSNIPSPVTMSLVGPPSGV